MKTRLFHIFTLLVALTASAQTGTVDVNAILASIEANNTQLRAQRYANEATVAEIKAENTIGETSVEYSPFFQKGTSGLASSELIVSQEFDFPTVYSNRRKSTTLQQSVLDKEYLVLRRDILLQAQLLCCDLTSAIEAASLNASRLAAADSLLSICNKRMNHGEATIMELNRAKLNRMNVQSEVAQNDGEINRLKVELQNLGAEPSTLVPKAATAQLADAPRLESEAEISLANANLEYAQHEAKTSRQAWLPKLTVGYRRNTELREASNGPMIGVSMPLFANSRKQKAARLRQTAAEQQLSDAQQQLDNRKRMLQTNIANLQSQLDTYDTQLLEQTLSTLMKAVRAGQMPIAEYYTEADTVYATLKQRLALLNECNKLRVELKNL